MDQIPQLPTTDMRAVIRETIALFTPLLEKRREVIESILRKTFKHGATDRHQIDIYYPTTPGSGVKPPILLYTYGGGLLSGDRLSPNGLFYANMGSFFAARGIIFAVPDYRLVPQVSYPSPVEDVRDALRWVASNLPEGDSDNIFVLGHSAGVSLLSTILFNPQFGPIPPLKGVIFNGGLYHYRGTEGTLPPGVLDQYHGSKEKAAAECPETALKALSRTDVARLPPIRMLITERDADLLKTQHGEILALLREKGATSVEEVVIPVHNHFSVVWVANSSDKGEGEEWLADTVHWIKAHAT